MAEYSRKKKEKDIIIPRKIHELTNKQVGNILFDSDIHSWSKDNNEFTRKLNGKKDIIIVIENDARDIFGGYIGSKINIGEIINDKKCFVFSFKKNNEWTSKRYNRNGIGGSYLISIDKRNTLFGFGIVNDGFGEDIIVSKKEESCGICQQECYDYNGEKNALTDSNGFSVEHILVYQLK